MRKLYNLNKNNICLIGMMGSGKSRVGKEIAKFYELDHYDTDVEIEKKYEKSIDFIFKKYGEKVMEMHLN